MLAWILLLYAFQVGWDQVGSTSVSGYLGLLLVLVIQLELALGLVIIYHARGDELAACVFVTAEVHRAQVVCLSGFSGHSVANQRVVWALINHAFAAACKPSACRFIPTVSAVCCRQVHDSSFSRSLARPKLVWVGLRHSELTYVIGMCPWPKVLWIMFLSVGIDVSALVIVAQAFDVGRCLSLDVTLTCSSLWCTQLVDEVVDVVYTWKIAGFKVGVGLLAIRATSLLVWHRQDLRNATINAFDVANRHPSIALAIKGIGPMQPLHAL